MHHAGSKDTKQNRHTSISFYQTKKVSTVSFPFKFPNHIMFSHFSLLLSLTTKTNPPTNQTHHHPPPPVSQTGTGTDLFQFLQPTTRRTSETFRQGIFQGINLQGQHLTGAGTGKGQGAAGLDRSLEVLEFMEFYINISQMFHVYGIISYLHLPYRCVVHVDKYSIHGAYGYCLLVNLEQKIPRSNLAKKHSDVAVEVAVNPIIYSLI